jgi:maltooligosyltrehalose trehalohydrolase
MLFQGQEFSSSAPFLYFADFDAELAEAVRQGRREFLSQFPSVQAFGESLPNPADEATFQRCKLDLAQRDANASIGALIRDLLRLRREEAAFSGQRRGGVDGAVLSPNAFAIRFFTPAFAADRLLIVNLGVELRRPSYAEPLLAPPAGTDWKMRWSTDDPQYGGAGGREPWTNGRWRIPPECALVLEPGPQRLPRVTPKLRRRS